MCYTISPVHIVEYYVKLAEELLALEIDAITIKDMAGILDPETAYKLVSMLKKELKVPVNVHTYMTSGFAVAPYLKAVEAGADYIDTSITPLAFGTVQPDSRTVYYSLPVEARPDLDIDVINDISSKLRSIVEEKYLHLINWRALIPDPSVLVHQISGGMFSNLIAQLREQNALDRLYDVLEEVARVREDLGYPPPGHAFVPDSGCSICFQYVIWALQGDS